MALTKEQILAAPLPREEVQTPEWGGSVFVRTISAKELVALQRAMRAHDDQSVAGVILAFTLCDEQGQALFTDADIIPLNNLAGVTMGRLLEVAERLNKFKPDDVDNAEKNSSASRGEFSSTGSQPTADSSSGTSTSA